jgi:hypothetical protein
MFKRDARDKVRQMGGIMASSAPLIQEVARFQFGGGVNFGLGFSPSKHMNILGKKGTQSQGGPPYAQLPPQQQPRPIGLGPYSMGFNIENVINPKTGGFKGIEYIRDNFAGGSAKDDVKLGRTMKQLDNNPRFKKFFTSVLGGKTIKESSSHYDTSGQLYDDILTEGLGLGWNAMIDVLFDKDFQWIPDRDQLTDAKIERIATGEDSIPKTLTKADAVKQIANSGLDKERKKELLKKLPLTDPGIFMEKERKRAIEGGMQDPDAKPTDEALLEEELEKALQRQFRAEEDKRFEEGGGRLKEVTADKTALVNELKGTDGQFRPQTLGVTADQGTAAKHKKASEDFLNGKTSMADVKTLVTDTVKSGVGTGGALKQLVKEFTDNAPEYKGMDKGLALAKIGFAMAAGESPNAITNIAKALEQGADMFIEDNAKRDEFNRQVQLSALQYGLGEVSKQRAQGRADARNFETYVVGKGGYTDPNGTEHEEGTMIRMSMAERLKHGNKMNNLASITAINERKAFQLKTIELQIKQAELVNEMSGGGVDPALLGDVRTMAKEYNKAMGIAEDSARAMGMFDGVKKMLNDPSTGDFSRGFKGFAGQQFAKGATFFGVTIGEEFNSVEQIEARMLQALPEITRVALGSTQSANSISDRDVLLQIIRPFFGGLIEEDKQTGKFKINLVTKAAAEQRIDAAMKTLLASQTKSLIEADGIYSTLSDIDRVKGSRSTGLGFIKTDIPRRSVFDLEAGEKGQLPVFDIVDMDGVPGLRMRGKG